MLGEVDTLEIKVNGMDTFYIDRSVRLFAMKIQKFPNFIMRKIYAEPN